MKMRKPRSTKKKHSRIGKTEIATSNGHPVTGASNLKPFSLELLKCISQDFDHRRRVLGAASRSEKSAKAIFARAEALWLPKVARWPNIERNCEIEGLESATKKAIDAIHRHNPSHFGIRPGQNGTRNYANQLAQIVGRLSIQEEIFKAKASTRLNGVKPRKAPPKAVWRRFIP
jgi:hypothetical protein